MGEGGGRRRVRVCAVVMAGPTEGPQDAGVAYRAVAEKLLELAGECDAGRAPGPLTAIEYPLVQFEAASEPLGGPDGGR